MKKLFTLLICSWIFAACSNDDTPTVPPTDEVEALLQKMTLREKVGQLFYVRLESLDPSIEWTTYDDLASLNILKVTENMKRTNENYLIEAFDAVMAAVNNGTISEERINQSVRRILKLKLQ